MDNSGNEKVRCIGALTGKVNSSTGVGDLITVSVMPRDVRNARVGGVSPLASGSVVKGLIVGTKKSYRGKGMMGYHQSSENMVVLLDKKGSLLGTRLKAPVPMEMRRRGYLKVVSLSLSSGTW